LDVGCGVGTWLSVLRERGVDDIQGVDGAWVDEQHLVIPAASFMRHDLSQPLSLPRRYDLAISLEVAEHLSATRAAAFVKFLTDSSDAVLFSAAIPHQGGRGHVNEQWPVYWAELFRGHGYGAVDCVRARIWNDSAIPCWYRQNILLFVAAGVFDRLPEVPQIPGDGLALIHPEIYLKRQRKRRRWKRWLRSLRGG
jgi:hypothetical protein